MKAEREREREREEENYPPTSNEKMSIEKVKHSTFNRTRSTGISCLKLEENFFTFKGHK